MQFLRFNALAYLITRKKRLSDLCHCEGYEAYQMNFKAKLLTGIKATSHNQTKVYSETTESLCYVHAIRMTKVFLRKCIISKNL